MARKRIETYSRMLSIQAGMGYPFERPLYETESWHKASRVLDIGCGDGSYLGRIQREFPEKRYVCVEHDPEMAARARDNLPTETTCLTGTVIDLPNDIEFDFVIARLVFSHLNDPVSVVSWISQHTSSDAGVLVIDAEDRFLVIRPDTPNFQDSLKQLRLEADARGANRDIREELRKAFFESDFTEEFSLPIIINTEPSGYKERMYTYMALTAELAVGSPVNEEISAELFDWLTTEGSHAQYGEFGITLTKRRT